MNDNKSTMHGSMHLSLLLLLPWLCQGRHLLSVLELGGQYYYHCSHLLYNRTFQVIDPYEEEGCPVAGGVPGPWPGNDGRLDGGSTGLGPQEQGGHRQAG